MSTVELAVMPEADARRITERIRYTAMSVRDGVDKLQRLVAEAQEGQAHIALGYASWTAYLADVMGEEPLRLAREERREVVAWLSGEGMSTRAIAPIVGTSQRTVANDIQADRDEDMSNFAHLPASRGVVEVITADPQTGEVIEDAESVAQPVVGLDGKTYARPEPKSPRRSSLVDDAYKANVALWKAVERIRSIKNDDRFNRNKADIRAALQPSADLATEILTDLFNSSKEEN